MTVTTLLINATATLIALIWAAYEFWALDKITGEGRDQLRALGFNV